MSLRVVLAILAVLVAAVTWLAVGRREAHAAELRQHAIAYINTDGNGRGFLGMGGSHTLETFINDTRNADVNTTWPFPYDSSLSLDGNRLTAAFRLANRRLATAMQDDEQLRGMATTAAVVLANKGPLVHAFAELTQAAKAARLGFAYSATVCGALPVVNIGQRDLAGCDERALGRQSVRRDSHRGPHHSRRPDERGAARPSRRCRRGTCARGSWLPAPPPRA